MKKIAILVLVTFLLSLLPTTVLAKPDPQKAGGNKWAQNPGVTEQQTVDQDDEQEVTFDDINDSWANGYIKKVAKKGLVEGYRGQYQPNKPVTNLELITMLVRALNLGNTPIIRGRFADVPAGSWYFFAVNQVAEAGIVQGYSDDIFGPEDPITREQMTVMCVRALRHLGALNHDDAHASILAPFIDRQAISGWAGASVSLAVEIKLIEGRSGEIFAPEAHASRAEAGVVILRMLDLIPTVQ